MTEDGVKPPWNQPHVIPLAFKRSPMFLFVLDIPTYSVPRQSS